MYSIGYMRGHQRGESVPILRLLRDRPFQHVMGVGFRWQHAHPVHLLRGRSRLSTYPLVTHHRTDGSHAGRAESIWACLISDIGGISAPGDDLWTWKAGRYARFFTPAEFWPVRSPDTGGPGILLLGLYALRHRQGRTDAFPSVAAGCNGRTDTRSVPSCMPSPWSRLASLRCMKVVVYHLWHRFLVA